MEIKDVIIQGEFSRYFTASPLYFYKKSMGSRLENSLILEVQGLKGLCRFYAVIFICGNPAKRAFHQS